MVGEFRLWPIAASRSGVMSPARVVGEGGGDVIGDFEIVDPGVLQAPSHNDVEI